MLTRFQRGVGKKGRQRIGFSRVGQRVGLFLQEVGRCVDQLVEILQPLTTLFFSKVVLAQTALVDQVLNDFGQWQVFSLGTQSFNQPDERADRGSGLAGEAGRRVVET